MRMILLALAAALAVQPAAAQQRMLFWNLTSTTLTGVALAPTGTTAFGPNQCANDRDGSVDHDERLRLIGIQPGHYDVQTTDRKGRVCLARNVAVSGEGRYAFSLADKDLTDCR